MPKTLLIGNFGAGNIGDEMILASALESYNDPIVMTTNPEGSRTFCEGRFQTSLMPPTAVRSFWKFLRDKNYRKQIYSLRERVDKIVFVGGGLFAIKFRACFLWYVVFRWCQYLCPKAPILMEYQGVDSHLGWASKWCAKYVFSRVDYISVRDDRSALALREWGIRNFEVTQDRVLVSLDKSQKFPPKVQKVVLFNALSDIDAAIWNLALNNLKGYEFVYVPFQPGDKNFVPKNFPGKVWTPKNKKECISAFQNAEYIIGERLHFLIMGKIFVGSKNTLSFKAPYSEKVKSFCEMYKINRLDRFVGKTHTDTP